MRPITLHVPQLFRVAAAAAITGALAVATLAGPTAVSAAPAPLVLGTHSTSAGTVLATPGGFTLYTFGSDTATHSNCTGGCAGAWPPLTLEAGQIAKGGTGVGGTFATLTRSDGSHQVVYNGKPLYTWQGDAKPGDATGQGVGGFSVARPGAAAKPATSIAAAAHAGTSHSGTFLTGHTISVSNGGAVTLRFHLSTAFSGKSITISMATRTSSTAHWGSYHAVTSVKVASTGYAYLTVHVKGWEAFHATYAGDSTHGPGTSSSIVAHGA
jgi:predicted lipoprotein with Yx(FWY)xxD motif